MSACSFTYCYSKFRFFSAGIFFTFAFFLFSHLCFASDFQDGSDSSSHVSSGDVQEDVSSSQDGSDFSQSFPSDYVTSDELASYFTGDYDSLLLALSSGSGSMFDAYLSSTIVDVFSRVISQHPFSYYVAYRSSNDSSEGYLVYSSHFPSVSSSSISFSDAHVCYYHRVYINNAYVYRYNVYDYDSYIVNYSSNSLFYSNFIEGYPSLSLDSSSVLSYLLLFLIVIFILFSLSGLRRNLS